MRVVPYPSERRVHGLDHRCRHAETCSERTSPTRDPLHIRTASHTRWRIHRDGGRVRAATDTTMRRVGAVAMRGYVLRGSRDRHVQFPGTGGCATAIQTSRERHSVRSLTMGLPGTTGAFARTDKRRHRQTEPTTDRTSGPTHTVHCALTCWRLPRFSRFDYQPVGSDASRTSREGFHC